MRISSISSDPIQIKANQITKTKYKWPWNTERIKPNHDTSYNVIGLQNKIMKWQNMSSLSETLNTDSLNASSLSETYDKDTEYPHILRDTDSTIRIRHP